MNYLAKIVKHPAAKVLVALSASAALFTPYVGANELFAAIPTDEGNGASIDEKTASALNEEGLMDLVNNRSESTLIEDAYSYTAVFDWNPQVLDSKWGSNLHMALIIPPMNQKVRASVGMNIKDSEGKTCFPYFELSAKEIDPSEYGTFMVVPGLTQIPGSETKLVVSVVSADNKPFDIKLYPPNPTIADRQNSEGISFASVVTNTRDGIKYTRAIPDSTLYLTSSGVSDVDKTDLEGRTKMLALNTHPWQAELHDNFRRAEGHLVVDIEKLGYPQLEKIMFSGINVKPDTSAVLNMAAVTYNKHTRKMRRHTFEARKLPEGPYLACYDLSGLFYLGETLAGFFPDIAVTSGSVELATRPFDARHNPGIISGGIAVWSGEPNLQDVTFNQKPEQFETHLTVSYH